MRLGITIVLLLCFTIKSFSQLVVNPLEYGLKEANTATDRYSILLKCHKDAVKKNAMVSYTGIDSIEIEIPEKFTSIPLTSVTDFAGCTIKVLNQQRNVFLYSMIQNTKSIEVSSENIDNADFRSIPDLVNGRFLLTIFDKSLWVNNRIGYNYGHTRKDVILVVNGKGCNKPIMSYNNPQSQAECKFCEVNQTKKVIKNLNIERDSKSIAITNIFKIENQNNVTVSDISVVTPQDNELYGDGIFSIANSMKIVLDNIRVDGTYSRTDKYGYAFNLNNICELTAKRLVAFGRWGILGTNNLQQILLEDCDINRFDIHCYGRNVECRRCRFSQLYNQFSSTYGKITYKNCIFTDFIPYLNGSSYNAYTPVDVVFERCTFNYAQRGNKRDCIAKITGLNNEGNKRPELTKKNLPNFSFSNCIFNIGENLKRWYLLNLGNVKNVSNIGYVTNITMNNVTINGDAAFDISNVKFETDAYLDISFNKIYKQGLNGKKEKFRMQPVTVGNSTTVKYNNKVVGKN